MNYYNEHDPKAAAWMRELIAKKLIPEGVVDERDIQEIRPSDLAEFVQCHFFAGIGGWPYALALAGWPVDRPVWTGSCPCQPFSAAGKGLGTADARHLWPVFAQLIRECQPPTVFGEQVASKAGREWLAGVFADLEGMGYQRAGADLCAAGVGAPHIRQRLFWVASSIGIWERRRNERGLGAGGQQMAQQEDGSHPANQSGDGCENALWVGQSDCSGREPGGSASTSMGHGGSAQSAGGISGLDIPDSKRSPTRLSGPQPGNERDAGIPDHAGDSASTPPHLLHLRMGYAEFSGLEGYSRHEHDGNQSRRDDAPKERSTAKAGSLGAWSNADVLWCRDNKARRVESGTFPLAYGIPGRVGLLRGYGNAIVPQAAQVFIEAFQSCHE